MAIYHCHYKIIGRSSGSSVSAASAYVSGSVVAGAAYRSGEKIFNDYDGKIHDYTNKKGITHSEIMLPENAPVEFSDRATLWNAVEKKNKRCDAQLARECDIALPIEFSAGEQIEVVREYIKNNFTDKGVCADFAIHDKGDGNPHAHILTTLDEVSPSGFGKRRSEERGYNYFKSNERLKGWREDWAETCNRYLKNKGFHARIDHRTLEAQGIDRTPTKHIGKAQHMKNKPPIEKTRPERIVDNVEIRALNRHIAILEQHKKELLNLNQKIRNLQEKKTPIKLKKSELKNQMLQLEQSREQFIVRIEREIEQLDRITIKEKAIKEAQKIDLQIQRERTRTVTREITKEILHMR